MKETCSGVLAGVVPNADAPGSDDGRIPVGTCSGVFGPGAEDAWAAPAVVASASATAANPIQRRERTERVMLGHTPDIGGDRGLPAACGSGTDLWLSRPTDLKIHQCGTYVAIITRYGLLRIDSSVLRDPGRARIRAQAA